MAIVSVIIPTYKHQEFVLGTLDSVFAQTFADYEVIVVNDGSPDDTAEILKPLVEAGRIRYIEQANQGQAAARNRGLAEAKGEFIALLDDDDWWPSDKLEWQVEVLRTSPAVVLVHGFARLFGGEPEMNWPGEDTQVGLTHTDYLQRSWIISPGSSLIRASALKKIGGFDNSLWGVDDWDLYIRLSSIGDFAYQYRLSLHYRLHENNASKDAWRMYVNACRLQKKHFGQIAKISNMRIWRNGRSYICECFYPVAFKSAKEAMLIKDWKRASQMWLNALRMKPFSLLRQTIFFLARQMFSKAVNVIS